MIKKILLMFMGLVLFLAGCGSLVMKETENAEEAPVLSELQAITLTDEQLDEVKQFEGLWQAERNQEETYEIKVNQDEILVKCSLNEYPYVEPEY